MNRGISAEDFEKLSNSAQKKHVVKRLIEDAGASPVVQGSPIAFVMAGIPGAGKTEFLDSFSEEIASSGRFDLFVRVDLDQIVTVFPKYTPKTYAKFRSKGSFILAGCIDALRKGRYNVMIDGTFAGQSGSSINNVERLLSDGYVVILVYMYDIAESAWKYTQLREIETDRGIDREGFIGACENVCNNLSQAIRKFRHHPNFSMIVIKQKELRDKKYDYIIKRY